MSREAPCPRSSEGRWRRWADYQRDKLPSRDEASAGRHLLHSSSECASLSGACTWECYELRITYPYYASLSGACTWEGYGLRITYPYYASSAESPPERIMDHALRIRTMYQAHNKPAGNTRTHIRRVRDAIHFKRITLRAAPQEKCTRPQPLAPTTPSPSPREADPPAADPPPRPRRARASAAATAAAVPGAAAAAAAAVAAAAAAAAAVRPRA